MEAHEMEETRWRREEDRENGLFQAGARSERTRLRPLLERCLKIADSLVEETDRPFLSSKADDLASDLRREMGKEG